MWPSTFNRKSATISGWQCLGDFAAVKQQLQKIRASTRISNSAKKSGETSGEASGCCNSSSRPLPPLPQGQQGNKSVRFALPEGGQGPAANPGASGSEGSDQGYESDQSRVSSLIIIGCATRFWQIGFERVCTICALMVHQCRKTSLLVRKLTQEFLQPEIPTKAEACATQFGQSFA